ncbi:hypothetical protein EFD32_1554 [Enterococcus faecalis D32]|nr:hypothetical protein EFD32_1554 [Enterococcus faecalis D32]
MSLKQLRDLKRQKQKNKQQKYFLFLGIISKFI